MANINLREYLTGIEELIESGQIEESLAHCRHILKHYPKHVDTYRMLGKAFLEAKRHGEASDIFQRVLSSAPDDFVAHIGMSIIREDESNLDAAIWHMERAFESQPSNRAVQDELRRLYGEREGFEPPKVRLTRGALARMYAHGDLYAQAISELRSALNEDPQRPDLQLLLARMYYLTNRKADAIEVCTRLLEKLPFCLYANHLMADILTEDNHAEEAQVYRQRVEDLDPYAAQVSTLDLVERVPAESVMVEHLALNGVAPRTEAAPRAWTGALEPIEEPSYTPEELPDWLSAGAEGSDREDQAEEISAPPGYTTDSPGEAFQFTADEGDNNEAPAEEAPMPESSSDDQEDIPDWLRELQPAGEQPPSSAEEEGEPGVTPSDTQPLWLQEFGAAGFEPTPLPEDELASQPSIEETLEGQADEAESGLAWQEEAPSDGEEDDGLAWLEGLAAKQGAGEEELITEPEDREADKPDWLKTPEEKVEDAASSMSWLDEMAAQVEAQPDEDIEEPEVVEEAALEPEDTEMEPAQAFSEPQQTEDQDSVPDWLRALGEEASQAPTTGDLDQSALDQPPDWLDELRPSTDELDQQDSEEEEDQEAWEPQTRETGDLSNLDWLQELGEPKGTPTGTLENEDIDWEAGEEPDQGQEELAAHAADSGAWVPESLLDEGEAESSVDEPAVQFEPAPEPAQPDPTPQPKTPAISSQAVESQQRLDSARLALNGDDLGSALQHYSKLVRGRKLLEEVIGDLEAALRTYDQDLRLWQTLGDAYMRDDRLREALDSYTKAEDLL